MRRRRRFTILRIALGFAIPAMLPVAAQAKPLPAWPDVEDHGSYQLGPGDVPYLDQTLHPRSPTPTPIVSDDGGASLDLNVYTVTGLSLALVLALGLGMGLTVWYYRRTNLSPV
jgi:hypothetical protein